MLFKSAIITLQYCKGYSHQVNSYDSFGFVTWPPFMLSNNIDGAKRYSTIDSGFSCSLLMALTMVFLGFEYT